MVGFFWQRLYAQWFIYLDEIKLKFFQLFVLDSHTRFVWINDPIQLKDVDNWSFGALPHWEQFCMQFCQKSFWHHYFFNFYQILYPEVRARNYWVSGCPGRSKMMTETQFVDQGFQPETEELSGLDSLILGFSDRKPRNCRGNPNTETGFPNGNPNFNHNF